MDYQKVNQRVEDLLEFDIDGLLENADLDNDIVDKLFDYQYLHVFNLITALRSYNCAVDGSDTGTGKTYAAIAACKQMRLRPFIICPKTVVTKWKQICALFDVDPITIVNYETIKHGKQYSDNDGKRIPSPWIEVIENTEKVNRKKKQVDVVKRSFKWKLPKYACLIFDEAHRCKSQKTDNAKLMIAAKPNRKGHPKVLMLSATLSDTPTAFNVFGFMLGFYSNVSNGRSWVNSLLRDDKNSLSGGSKMSALSRAIYPNHGSRMRISELGDKFPQNQVSAECYNIGKSEENEANKMLDVIYEGVTLKKTGGADVLTAIQQSRMKLELIKIPIFVDLIKEYHDNGYSVVVFVNFVRTLKKLASRFSTKSMIWGGQDTAERDKVIDDFQHNRTNIIICNTRAGGSGISLHDEYGKPRVSLISPSFSSTDFEQVLGRIHRAGSCSPALQRIIFCANTCEEVICARVRQKLEFTSKLNEDDLVNIVDTKNVL